MELKEKLSRLRKEKGLTQLELAEALNVSRQAVSRWEVGTAVPALDNLVSLSGLYGVPLDDLVQKEVSALPVPEDQPPDAPPPPPPPKAGALHTPLVSLLLAVLLLGVGIFIGFNLPREREVSNIDPGERVIVTGPRAWLERSPTDIEDELDWLEEKIKELLEKEDPSS